MIVNAAWIILATLTKPDGGKAEAAGRVVKTYSGGMKRRLEEADHPCDRLAIVDHGKVAVEGAPH